MIPSLSLCILTFNQGPRLRPLLEQANWLADEVLVVDSGSTDNTVALAASFPRVRLIQRVFDGNFAKQRNFAIESARCDWVLFLDSDELLGPNALRLVPHVLRSRYKSARLPIYWLAREDPPLFVKTDKHYPCRRLRLFRRLPEMRYLEDRPVHERMPNEVHYPCLFLRHAHILHYSFVWLDPAARREKMARYEQYSEDSADINRMYQYEQWEHVLAPCEEAWRRGRPYLTWRARTLGFWGDLARIRFGLGVRRRKRAKKARGEKNTP